MDSISELNVLITGAGSGVGRGLAMHFGEAGRHVICTDLNEAAANETARQITDAGGSARSLALDVTSESDVQQTFAALDGPVHVLINNAGIQHVAPLEDFPQETWDRVVAVLMKGPVLMTRAALPGMRRAGFGRIVNIGSIHSIVASAYKTAYVTAKHALLGFSKVIALETADTDITINTICPAYIRTPLVDKQIADQARAHGMNENEVIEKIMLRPMPKKAFITIEEVAAAADYLIGAAARNITGQAITIDGGWTIQ